MGCGGQRWDAFAVHDALALRAEIAIAGLEPALDPRFRPLLDEARRRLREVSDEAGLEVAVAGFHPIVNALARWPGPREPSPPRAGTRSIERRDLIRIRPNINGVSIPSAPDPPGVLDALAPTRRRREASLARPSVRRIEQALRAAPRGLTAQEVAAAVGRHHTGVRARLAELERIGVVEVSVNPPAGRGRPARRYVLAPDPAEREAAGHRELVRLLVSLVREAGFGPIEVERFGERQGASIARPGGGVGEIRDAFERLGFAPRTPGDGAPGDVVLDRCPFAEGVEAPDGGLICLLHRGLARGIAREAAPGTEVLELEVKEPRRAGCRLRLSSPPATRDDAPAGGRRRP